MAASFLVLMFTTATLVSSSVAGSVKFLTPPKLQTVRDFHMLEMRLPQVESLTGRESRIVNGNVSSVGQFPYQVSVVMDSAYFCCGSLISTSTILTSAFCTSSYTSFAVSLGSLDPFGGGEGSEVRTTREKIIHGGYDAATITNDIGLLLLETPVTFTVTISAISLPTDVENTYAGDVARVSGWGKTSDAATDISHVLRFVDLQVLSNADCALVYGNGITDNHLCTQGIPNGATCAGDAGAPLQVDGVQIGLVAFVPIGGCESGKPDGFTRTTSYLTWIQSNARP